MIKHIKKPLSLCAVLLFVATLCFLSLEACSTSTGANAAEDVANAFNNTNQNIVSGLDTDQDGLPDDWEINGVDIDGDGIVEVPLPQMGADPNVPDVFVEADWMIKPASAFQNEISFAPSADAMKLVYDAFDKRGIHLHVDAGPDSIDYVTNKAWGDLSEAKAIDYTAIIDITSSYGSWQKIVSDNLNAARLRVFHYAIFADNYDAGGGPGSTGIANNIPGQFFIVAQGAFLSLQSNPTSVAGTFMHELGHTLGLRHGGGDDQNGKPNYLSIMNYTYQLSGLAGTGAVDYCAYELPTLDMNNLSEATGLDPDGLSSGTGLGAVWNADDKSHMVLPISRQPVDYNQNGTTTDTSVQTRFEYSNGGEYFPITTDPLTGFNDWSHILYASGGIGLTSPPPSSGEIITPIEEHLFQDILDIGRCGNPGDGSLEALGPFCIISQQGDPELHIRVYNLSASDSVFDLSVREDTLVGEYQQSVSVPASVGDLSFELVSVPLKVTAPLGVYFVDCTLSYNGKRDIEISVPVVVCELDDERIADIVDAIISAEVSAEEKILNYYREIFDQQGMLSGE